MFTDLQNSVMKALKSLVEQDKGEDTIWQWAKAQEGWEPNIIYPEFPLDLLGREELRQAVDKLSQFGSLLKGVDEETAIGIGLIANPVYQEWLVNCQSEWLAKAEKALGGKSPSAETISSVVELEIFRGANASEALDVAIATFGREAVTAYAEVNPEWGFGEWL